MTAQVSEEQFEKYYASEQYNWVASAPVRIPWYRCTMRCTVIEEQALSELDYFFCQAILSGIDTEEDLAFVFSLDRRIVQGELEALEADGMVRREDGAACLTEAGMTGYQKRSKSWKHTEYRTVFMNGVSGRWAAAPPGADVPPQESAETAILTLPPLCIPQAEDAERQFERLCGVEGTLLAAAYEGFSAMEYCAETLLVYQQEEEIKIAFWHEEAGWDIEVGAALTRQYERRALLGLLDIERLVRDKERHIVEHSSCIRQSAPPDVQYQYCRNREIRELFKNSFQTAEQSVFIVSPWIDQGGYVVTEDLLSNMESALRRGIRLSIGYGYLSPEKHRSLCERMEQSAGRQEFTDKNWQTEQMARSLRRRFASYPQFEIFHIGTHEKILIIDDRDCFVGSFNLLSYDGGEKDGFSGFQFRFEGGVRFTSPEFARQVKDTIIRR